MLQRQHRNGTEFPFDDTIYIDEATWIAFKFTSRLSIVLPWYFWKWVKKLKALLHNCYYNVRERQCSWIIASPYKQIVFLQLWYLWGDDIIVVGVIQLMTNGLQFKKTQKGGSGSQNVKSSPVSITKEVFSNANSLLKCLHLISIARDC